MSEEASLQIIRNAFAHIDVSRFAVEHDQSLNAKIVKIFVREDQLDAAFEGNGEIARRAAMESGMDVEIVLSGD